MPANQPHPTQPVTWVSLMGTTPLRSDDAPGSVAPAPVLLASR